MKFPFVLLCLLSLCSSSCSNHDVFSSTTELRKLVKYEYEMVQKLGEYADALQKDLHTIKSYISNSLTRMEKESDNSVIVSNPFHAYHILKRTTVDLEDVLNVVKNNTLKQELARECIRRSEQLPSYEDFIGGSMALVGLQDTYGFNISDIMHGTILDGIKLPQSPYKLTARDFLFLGKAAFNKGLYNRAVDWLDMALLKSDEEARDKIVTAPREEILPFIETTRRVHDDILEERGPSGETWQTFSKPLNPVLAKKAKYQEIKAYKPRIYEYITPHEENENFKRLCRGEDLRVGFVGLAPCVLKISAQFIYSHQSYERNKKSAQLESNLKCRFRSRPNTISLIGPFKLEEKSLEPYVVLIHDFMNELEMSEFRDTASSRLKRSLHQGKNGRYVATDIRTSNQAWLTEDDHSTIGTINKRISEATGLLTSPENEASELFQVANYGMAGRYTPHTDYITGEDHFNNPTELRRGNRIATFMIYLEDVLEGGATSFPLIGVRISPKKGAAVFWYNLRRDGTGDGLTRHGGCPVLFGEKWIANKWIRANHQFQTAPCTPKADDFIRGH